MRLDGLSKGVSTMTVGTIITSCFGGECGSGR